VCAFLALKFGKFLIFVDKAQRLYELSNEKERPLGEAFCVKAIF